MKVATKNKFEYKPLIEISTSQGDLAQYNLINAKVDEFYCLKVVERKENYIAFDLVKLDRNQ